MNGFEALNTTASKFMNTVRENIPPEYRNQLPIAEAGQESFTGVGKALEKNKFLANVWHDEAANLIGKIIQNDNKIYNPLAEFEGDLVETGAEMEEMIIDTAATFAFNPSKAEVKLFERREPELRSAIHTNKRDVTTIRTLQDTQYTEIFRSTKDLDRYILQVTQSILSGNESEKYYTTKELVSMAAYKGSVRVLDLGQNVSAKNIQKVISKIAKSMVHPSRNWNAGKVNIQADFSELRMLLPINTSVDLNVDFFANVFHLDAVKSGLAIKEVDYFPNIYEYTKDHIVTAEDHLNLLLNDYNFDIGEVVKAGSQASEAAFLNATADGGLNDVELKFDASRIQAVILDRRVLKINPQLVGTFATQPNAAGRYTQLIFNEKEFFGYSPFLPSAVIMANDPIDIADLNDVKIDGISIVDGLGVANIEYTAETREATEAVFGEVEEAKQQLQTLLAEAREITATAAEKKAEKEQLQIEKDELQNELDELKKVNSSEELEPKEKGVKTVAKKETKK